MTITYTDGMQKVVIKQKYAYHYNKAGSLIKKTEMKEGRKAFIDQLWDTGFRPTKVKYGLTS